MIWKMDFAATTPCCGFLPDVEYVRRKLLLRGQNVGFVERALKMQVLIPNQLPKPEGGFPLVVFVVGGGFREPRVQFRVPWLARLAEMGFVVMMPEYRGSESSAFPAMAQDVHTAVRFARKNAAWYGANPDKIVLMGASAGGTLALLCAYDNDALCAPDDDRSVSGKVCGVIDLYGVSNFSRMLELELERGGDLQETVAARLTKSRDCAAIREAIKPFEPLGYISQAVSLPPALIAHGDADRLVPISQSEELYQALKEAGKDVQFYVVEGAAHADRKFFQKEMMDVYAEFIRRVTE